MIRKYLQGETALPHCGELFEDRRESVLALLAALSKRVAIVGLLNSANRSQPVMATLGTARTVAVPVAIRLSDIAGGLVAGAIRVQFKASCCYFWHAICNLFIHRVETDNRVKREVPSDLLR